MSREPPVSHEPVSYEVVSTIARGGMGVVELARDAEGRSVALKRLTLHGTADQMRAARQRLEREAQVLRGLDHPAVIPLIDLFDDDGEPVLVMPHLSGGTLADRVDTDGPLPEAEVEALAGRMLAALAAAHRAGVVHRDVKPGNVLFDESGGAHLADFGIAITRDATPGLTGDGLVLGTPGYLAPEQARGEEATPASDVFALGATLQFALTGEGPFGRGDPRVLLYRASKGTTTALPREIRGDLRRMLESMLEARPDRRPTAAELAGGPDGTTVMPAPRRRNAMVGGVVAATVLAMIVAVAVARTGDGSSAADESAGSVTTDVCEPLSYQPCGADGPAPFTDGRVCVDDHDDYDGDPTNGCETAPDGIADGTELVDRVEANLVPRSDIDTLVTVVDDNGQLLCDGAVRFTITAPPDAAMKLVIRRPDGEVVGELSSADGVTDELRVDEPSCGSDDSTTFTLEVSPVGQDRSPEDYVLTRRGNF